MKVNDIRNQLDCLDSILNDNYDVIFGLYSPSASCTNCNGTGIIGFDKKGISLICECVENKQDEGQDYISYGLFKQLCNRSKNDNNTRSIEDSSSKTK